MPDQATQDHISEILHNASEFEQVAQEMIAAEDERIDEMIDDMLDTPTAAETKEMDLDEQAEAITEDLREKVSQELEGLPCENEGCGGTIRPQKIPVTDKSPASCGTCGQAYLWSADGGD